jgi:hypothetical protein
MTENAMDSMWMYEGVLFGNLFHRVCASTARGISSPSNVAMEALEEAWFAWCRTALRFCCDMDDSSGLQKALREEEQRRKRATPRLICYLDGLSDELVRRQLNFRRKRRMERDASHTSLSSLAVVSEDLEDPEDWTDWDDSEPRGMHKTMSTPSMSTLFFDEAFQHLQASSSAEKLNEARRSPTYHVVNPRSLRTAQQSTGQTGSRRS